MTQIYTLSIKAARIENGFTQSSLAKKIGVTKRTIGMWENGEQEMKPYALYALAYVFGMDAEQIRLPVLRNGHAQE